MNPLPNRREIARSALFGGAAALFTSSATAGPADSTSQTLLDARQFGALGDGKTDDTAALQRALDAAGTSGGVVVLVPGVYLTGELHLRERTALIGTPAWRYSSAGGPVLRLASPDAFCLLNMTEALGATVDGIALEGGYLGKGVHGIATRREKWGEQLKGREITSADVRNFVKNNAKPKRMVAVKDIVKIISDFYSIEEQSIYDKTRRKEIIKPRQIIMYILREDFNISYPSIGDKLGGRDHTTVIHSCEKIRNELKSDQSLSEELSQIRNLLSV